MRTLKREPILQISVVFSVFLLVFKFLFISNSYLIDDEAYYALWAQHLGFGYIEHGPGIAWFIRATSSLFGMNGLGIRLGGFLAFLLLSASGYLFGRRIHSECMGWVLAVMFNLTPFLAGTSFIITPDTPMLFFVFLALFTYHKAIFEDARYYWLGGLFLGLATLSKIPAAFIGVGVLGYHFLSKNRKELLMRWEMWGGFILSVLLYLPFILWNAFHDWPFVRFVFYILDKPGSWKSMGDLWAAQLGLWLPTLFLPMIILLFSETWKYIRHKKK